MVICRCGAVSDDPEMINEHNRCAPITRPYCAFHGSYDCLCPYLSGGRQTDLYRRQWAREHP
jgi:hypothetical protein